MFQDAKVTIFLGKHVTVNALHPGIIETEFVRIPWLATLSKYTTTPFLKVSIKLIFAYFYVQN